MGTRMGPETVNPVVKEGHEKKGGKKGHTGEAGLEKQDSRAEKTGMDGGEEEKKEKDERKKPEKSKKTDKRKKEQPEKPEKPEKPEEGKKEEPKKAEKPKKAGNMEKAEKTKKMKKEEKSREEEHRGISMGINFGDSTRSEIGGNKKEEPEKAEKPKKAEEGKKEESKKAEKPKKAGNMEKAEKTKKMKKEEEKSREEEDKGISRGSNVGNSTRSEIGGNMEVKKGKEDEDGIEIDECIRKLKEQIKKADVGHWWQQQSEGYTERDSEVYHAFVGRRKGLIKQLEDRKGEKENTEETERKEKPENGKKERTKNEEKPKEKEDTGRETKGGVDGGGGGEDEASGGYVKDM